MKELVGSEKGKRPRQLSSPHVVVPGILSSTSNHVNTVSTTNTAQYQMWTTYP